jgi:predicted flap endonuclease-1-like 5' DNA nuclease
VAPAKPMPKPAAKIAGEDKVPGKRPPGYAKPIDGKADDLKRIRGIGQQNEGRLHGLGIWHFAQVAKWSAQECLWVGSYLAFPGRIEREEWVKQAKQLATGKDTQFSRRVAKGLVATSQDRGDKGQKNVEVVKPMRAQKGVAPKGTKK